MMSYRSSPVIQSQAHDVIKAIRIGTRDPDAGGQPPLDERRGSCKGGIILLFPYTLIKQCLFFTFLSNYLF